MLNECRLAMRITTEAYDGELCRLMDAAAHDLAIAGVELPGTVAFTVTESGISDTSTLTDAMCQQAIFTYVRMHFGTPNDYIQLRDSYDLQKTQLMHASGYTDYGDGGGDDGQS